MSTLPRGWTQQPQSGDDPKIYYQATIGNYIARDGKSITIVARSDEFGNYQLYELGLLGGLGTPFYSFNNSGTKTGSPGNLNIKDFNSVNQSVKQRSFEINQSVGNEKTDISNTEGYKSLGQVDKSQKDKSPGTSTDQTGGNGNGEEQSTQSSAPNVSTFSSSAEKFNKDGKYNSDLLIYPRDINDEQDRIVFIQHYYKSAIGDNNTIDIGVNTFTKERYSTIAEKDLLGTVVLPMPNDISETNVTAWGEDSLSTLAAMVGSAALAGTGNLASGNFGGTLQEARQLLGDVFGNQPGAKEAIEQFLNLNAAASVVKMAGINFNPEAFRARITGTAINPNMELLFQGPKLRSFGFQFKMTPRNALEAKNIRYILKFFKKGMAPKRASDQPFFLGAPNVFDIHFRSGKNASTDYNKDLKSIGRIKTCALQQCVVNYTPDGFYAAYMDTAAGGSQPISVQLQMTFTELTPIYNDNYDEKDLNNVGWDKLDFEYTQSSTNQ